PAWGRAAGRALRRRRLRALPHHRGAAPPRRDLRGRGDPRRRHHRDHRRPPGGAGPARPAQPFRTADLPRGARRLPRRARERRRRRQGGDRMMEWLDNPVFTTWDTNTSLWSNTLITLYMTVGTMLFSTLIGVPLGLLLFETSGGTPIRVENSMVPTVMYRVIRV